MLFILKYIKVKQYYVLSSKVKNILQKDRFNLIVINDYLEKQISSIKRSLSEDIYFDNKNTLP